MNVSTKIKLTFELENFSKANGSTTKHLKNAINDVKMRIYV